MHVIKSVSRLLFALVAKWTFVAYSYSPDSGETTAGGIPFIIHQTWKTERIPAYLAEYRDSWLRLHNIGESRSKWKYIFWSDKDLENFVEKHCYSEIPKEEYKTKIQFVDAARYCVLYHVGGIFVDLDYQALRPMDLLLHTFAFDEDAQLILTKEPPEHSRLFMQNYIVSNAIMFSKPFHPLLKHALNSLKPAFEEMKHENNTSHQVMYSTGPFFLTHVYRLVSCLCKNGQVTTFDWADFPTLASEVECSSLEILNGSKNSHIRLLEAEVLNPKPLFLENGKIVANKCYRSKNNNRQTLLGEDTRIVDTNGDVSAFAFAQHHWCGTWWENAHGS